MAFSPACRQYARALSHTSPRRAWWASRSTGSATRLSGAGFEGLDDPRVQGAPPLLEETAVGHFLREGVLEGVLALGKELGLVQELGAPGGGRGYAAALPRAARRWPAAGRRRRPCRSPRPLARALPLRSASGPCGPPAPPGWCSGPPGPSRPSRAPAPCEPALPERRDCPPLWPAAAVPEPAPRAAAPAHAAPPAGWRPVPAVEGDLRHIGPVSPRAGDSPAGGREHQERRPTSRRLATASNASEVGSIQCRFPQPGRGAAADCWRGEQPNNVSNVRALAALSTEVGETVASLRARPGGRGDKATLSHRDRGPPAAGRSHLGGSASGRSSSAMPQ